MKDCCVIPNMLKQGLLPLWQNAPPTPTPTHNCLDIATCWLISIMLGLVIGKIIYQHS